MELSDTMMSTSRLRPPSRIQPPSIGLSEMTASENNARSGLPAPTSIPNALKHRPTGLQESQSKISRVTLAERAAEPYRKPSAPSTIRQVNREVDRVSKAGPKSTYAVGRGLAAPEISNSTSGSRPGIPRSQTFVGRHARSKSHHAGARPVSAMGQDRTSSQSTQGQALHADNNGSTPFLSVQRHITQTVSTSNNVSVRGTSQGNSKYRTTSDSSRANTSSSTSASISDTLVGPADNVLDMFTTRSRSGRQSSLCRHFGGLRVLSGGVTSAGETGEIFGHARALMPPPAIPLPNPILKHKSSIPVFSPPKQQGTVTRAQSLDNLRSVSPPPSATPSFSLCHPKKRKTIASTPSPTKTPKRIFLTKDSNDSLPAWSQEAIEKRLTSVDDMMRVMSKQMEGTTFEKKTLQDIIEVQRSQAAELHMQLKDMGLKMDDYREQLKEVREENSELVIKQTEMKRNHDIEVDDLDRKHRYELEGLREEHRKEVDQLRRGASEEDGALRRQHREEVDELRRKHREEIDSLDRRFKGELEEEKERRLREVNEISMQRDEAMSKIATGIGEKEREAEKIRDELRQKTADLELERTVRGKLDAKLSEASASTLMLESANVAMKAKIEFLESDNQQQSNQFAELHKRMQDAIDVAAIANQKLRAEESLRRKLHNQVQELKGNIRVFCRVRPILDPAEEPEGAKITFPDREEDSKEICVRGQETTSALGKVSATDHAFNFDRVFGPSTQNADVFDEISQLVQSALDGYNVCIFCYGQTGSGKTFTMSSVDGMIPRAVKQIYESATALEEKGWKYKMAGSFVEVYNETLNDLLGKAEDLDKKKHEIHHDKERGKTTITDVEVMDLDSPDSVAEVLKRADKNRSVAATKANMRSSRSHSVFILTLTGTNSITGEKCEGTLNLVDLAGSERLSHSQAEGQRLKETQNINKSLSCLGDVISALGSSKDGAHIPYRNSKLTYLLQFSLGGNSKTLMFVMVSPLRAHLSETITSLKFATKVHNTHIGTAKRQTRV